MNTRPMRLYVRRHDRPRALPTWLLWLMWAVTLGLLGVAIPVAHYLACQGRIGL